MNLQLVSDIVFALGRRAPRAPTALLRAMPPGLLRALRAPGLRETFRVATRASYYRDAFAAAHVDVARARRPEDLGDFYLTPEVLKTRPEALLAGTPELAIESSGTSGRVTRVYLSRRELEYNARQGGLLYGLYGLGRGDRLLCTLDLGWGLGSLLVERGVRLTPLLASECTHRVGYHVTEFDFYVEVAAPDAEGYGEVILTTVNRRVMPLIRYRTGDVARWFPGPCPCGLPFRRLSPLRGRLDEQVSCAWGNLRPEFFEPLLREVPGLGGDWQVGLYERELTPVVQLRLELQGDGAARERAVQEVLGALQRTRPEAWLAYCQRLLDVEFAFFAPGTLRQQRKLLRLVDERRSGPPAWVERAVGRAHYGRTANPSRWAA